MNNSPNAIVRFVSALIVVVVSVSIAGFFAVVVNNNSVPDVAGRNMLVTFLIIGVPLMFIGFRLSQRLLSSND